METTQGQTTENNVRFRKADIDRAIVCTVADLDGVNHPLGFKLKKRVEDQKSFTFIPRVLLAFAAGYGGLKGSEPSFMWNSGDPNEVANACRIFVASCDGYQKQAVQHLIKIIFQETKERNSSKEASTDNYYLPISKENHFGERLLLLAEAFEVEIPTE